jgi:hypoxia up-regulated 1
MLLIPFLSSFRNIQFTPEELMGMLLNYSRELAQDYARTSIRDAIITIPAFFNQAQRRAVLQAAQLVGLNVLQLMTDGAAVALNFGLFRQNTFNTTPFYIMFYDMGSTSTIATIAEYKKVQVKEGSTAHIHPQVRIRGVGFDRTLGGLEMEMRLRDHLAKIFTSKHKTTGKITDSPRAMAKLLKEAKRVKTVLSANTEIFAQVEGLFEDVDFSTKVTRNEFEDLCEDLFDRIDDPINQALKVSDITMVRCDVV